MADAVREVHVPCKNLGHIVPEGKVAPFPPAVIALALHVIADFQCFGANLVKTDERFAGESPSTLLGRVDGIGVNTNSVYNFKLWCGREALMAVAQLEWLAIAAAGVAGAAFVDTDALPAVHRGGSILAAYTATTKPTLAIRTQVYDAAALAAARCACWSQMILHVVAGVPVTFICKY